MNRLNDSSDRATWWEAALMIRGQTEAEQRNIRSVWIWSLVWAVGLCIVLMILGAFPELEGASAWLIAMIPIALAVPSLLAHLRFIREADEFIRMVQLHGMAIGFATGFLFCMGYQALEHVGAPNLPLIVAAAPMGFGWAIGSFIVAYRHR